MKKIWTLSCLALASFAAGVTLAPLVAPRAEAQSRPGAVRGAGHAGISLENYRFTAGREASTVRTQRDEIVVDNAYGGLINITEVKGRTVIWYGAADGTVRNVIIEDGTAPVRITRQ